MSKTFFPFLLALGLVAIISCGGSGVGSGTTSTATTATTAGSGPFLEASVGGLPTDLTNLQVGDIAQIVVATYDSNNVRSTTTPTGMSATDHGAVATLGTSTLTANVSDGNTYTLTAVGGSQSASAPFKIKPVQARVTGGVVVAGTSTPVQGVTVLFYNTAGTLVGSAVSQFDGTFNASVPTSATLFTLDATTISSAFAKQFGFATKSFVTGFSCAATLPALTSGAITSLSTPIALYQGSSGPPPPPTGCGG